MSDVKREATVRLAVADKAVGGFGGGMIKIRHYESSSEVDFEVSTPSLVLSSPEAIMIAKHLLMAAMPSEEDFWPDEAEES